MKLRTTKKSRPAETLTPTTRVAPAALDRQLTMLPELAAALFTRMTDDERLEFLRLVGAECFEQWLARLKLSAVESCQYREK